MKLKLLLACLLMVLTVGVYWPVNRHEFVSFDDPDYVTKNHVVQEGLTWQGVGWAFTTSQASNWHPLTWLSHMLDCHWFGLNPRAHHLTSVFFHALNSVLLLLFLHRLTGRLERSVIVAALFALHPLHVESVAWVAERKDVLSAFFWILTLWAYVRYTVRPGLGRYLLVALSFAFGLMAKPMVVTLPFVLLLLDIWPLGRWRLLKNPRASPQTPEACPPCQFHRLLLEKLPLLLLSVASSAVTYLVQIKGGATEYSEFYPMEGRIANALVAYARYLGKTVWPVDLAALYPLPPAWPAWTVIGATLLLLVISLLTVLAIRTRPYLLTGWLWFLGTLVPVIGLVKVGGQSMADRYTYLPLIGIFIGIVWLVSDTTASSAFGRMAARVLTASVLLACMVGVRHQLPYWQNDERLYTRMVTVTTDNVVGHFNLGVVLRDKGQMEQATSHFLEVFRINPEYYVKVAKFRPDDAEAHYNMGIVFMGWGRHEDARTNLVIATSLSPTNAMARFMLGKVLMAQRKTDEAIAQLSEAHRLAPNHLETRLVLAAALDLQHRASESIPHYRAVLQSNPDQVEAMKSLTWILATHPQPELRNGIEAVALGKKLCELTGATNAVALGTLAAAYAEAGQFADAIATAQAARERATQAGQSGVVAMLVQHLQSYQANHPWREQR